MKVTESTSAVQENSTSVPQVSTAFADLNPPMNRQFAGSLVPVPVSIPLLAERPRTLAVAAVQAVAPELPTLPDSDAPHWKTSTSYGVVTVINVDWMPKRTGHVPPGLTNGLGMFLSAQWAMMFNGSTEARRRRHWALVTNRGTVLVLSGIKLEDRPLNPSSFPPCVQGGLNFDAADQFAQLANTPRCEFARVPREWTIAVRRADSVEAETSEGGGV